MNNTDEPQKSIWKKSWNLPGSFLGWMVLVTGLAFVVSLLAVIILDQWRWRDDWGIIIAGTVGGVIVAWLLLFIRWLCCWRNFRRFLLGLTCFAVLIALFYAEEDWRGWHAWQKFKHEWEAKGERFNMAGVIPQTVPDDQNFALTPIVASCYSFMLDKNGHQIRPELTNVVDRLRMEIAHYDDWPTNGTGSRERLRISDLKVWQNYYRALAAKTNEFPVASQPQTPAADVLLALSKYDSAIEELRQASQMPYSRFPLNYDSESPSAILLPHLAAMKRCTQVLELRAIAELQNGQSEKALDDIKLLLRLTDSMRTEPFLISHLVRIAMLNIAFQPVWEGLAEHKWSDAQLAELERELAKLDFLADYKLSMRGELGFQGGEMERLRRHPGEIQGLSGCFFDDEEGNASNPSLPGKFAARLIPIGWFYQNQLRCARMMVDYYLPLADMNQGTFSPALARRGDAALTVETKSVSPFNVLERLMLPELGGTAKIFAYNQAFVDMARMAIALERYRLAHGEYPESLDTLTPQFIAKLPHDIINGQPLHYRRDASGQFVLYSVGWNEKDDNGVVGLNKDGGIDRNAGDWVWRYPAK
jgi:hypothetical protein